MTKNKVVYYVIIISYFVLANAVLLSASFMLARIFEYPANIYVEIILLKMIYALSNYFDSILLAILLLALISCALLSNILLVAQGLDEKNYFKEISNTSLEKSGSKFRLLLVIYTSFFIGIVVFFMTYPLDLVLSGAGYENLDKIFQDLGVNPEIHNVDEK